MGLTENIALEEVQKLYDLCFDANSLCDRISYVLSIKFNMIKFGDWFHHNIAHYMVGDALADGIEAYGELRGDLFYRGVVAEHREDFEDVATAMEVFTLKVAEIEKQCIKALKSCAENGAEGYEDFLRDLNLHSISPLLKQATVFYNQIKAYSENDDLHKWNKDFGAWLIPQFGG